MAALRLPVFKTMTTMITMVIYDEDADDDDHDHNDADILAGHPYGCIRLKTRILPKLRFGRRYKFYYNPKWLYS